MAAPAYWKFPCEKIGSEWIFQKTVILNNVSKNAEYAKARLYGQVVTCRIGCLVDDYLFVLPQMVIIVLVIWFCFCTMLEKFMSLNNYKRLTFPPRYHQMSKLEQSVW